MVHSTHIQDIPTGSTSHPFWVWVDITTQYFITTTIREIERYIKQMTSTPSPQLERSRFSQ